MSDIALPAFLSSRLKAAAKALHEAGAKMPDDRVSWKPPVEGNAGRDALDQLVECAYLNEWAARAFAEVAVPPFDDADYKGKKDAHRNKEAALKWLQAGTDRLAAAVAAFPTSRTGDTLQNPFTQQSTTWAEFADFFYWNTVYHEGQVNYIQVLYGDMS